MKGWPVMSGVETGVVEIPETEVLTRTHAGRDDEADDWLCFWCLNRVAHEKDRFELGGKSEFTFANPAGMRFNILTFSPTFGCRRSGAPTLEHTWFPDHAWSFCMCDGCGMHLGWFYSGPSEFAGLIQNRIVRASLIRS